MGTVRWLLGAVKLLLATLPLSGCASSGLSPTSFCLLSRMWGLNLMIWKFLPALVLILDSPYHPWASLSLSAK